MKSIKNIILLLIGASLASTSYGQLEDYMGAGNYEGLTVTSSSSSLDTDAENTVNGSGMDADLMAASRFLTQSTMGYDREDIEILNDLGIEAWLDEQFSMEANYLTPQMEEIWDTIYGWQFDFLANEYLMYNPDSTLTEYAIQQINEEIFGPANLHFNYAWYQNTINSEDQLRQRMAWALSQILVVSGESDLGDHAHAMTVYYDLLLEHAFGNYRDLLLDVTLSPSMGAYLSHYNNPREVPEENLHPDENYAREIMQLFTIGLYELNLDGTRKVDAGGFNVPTYNSRDIKEMAKVFTGLGAGAILDNPWVDVPYFGMDWYIADKTNPLVMYEEWHEPGTKTLLGEVTLPAGRPGLVDVVEAVDFLFNHPNVGPFIGRQLIQRLVKSNPSPSYIERVARVFNDNGQGVRGDLKSVLSAILMDEEARSCEWILQESSAHFTEPLLRALQLSRSFPLTCFKDTMIFENGDTLYEQVPCSKVRPWFNGYGHTQTFRQRPLGAPTVFNFYLPDHTPVGEMANQGLVGPEFKIHDSATSINYINYLYASIIWNSHGGSWEGYYYPDVGWLGHDFTEIEDWVEGDPEETIHYLDILYTRGQLSDFQRSEMRYFINNMPDWESNFYQTRGLILLTLMSPDFTVTR